MTIEDRNFEDEVRRIARLRWPRAEGGGATMEDGRERDGIFVTEEMVHLIECTTSRTLAKAKNDIDKLSKLSKDMRRRYPSKGVKGYFITREEPTSDQRAEANKHDGLVVAQSFEEFRKPLVDAPTYLANRRQYPFGSMRDPSTGKSVADFPYIEPDIVSNDGEKWTITQLQDSLAGGHNIVILGDYGAGKSTTMRQLFCSDPTQLGHFRTQIT
jgi:ATPase subunit of ABC transporter with duplicated ATPase domains